MTEIPKLITPRNPGDPSIPAQLTNLFEAAAREAGAFVFDHPEEHCFNIVFGGHQITVSVTDRK